MENSAYIYRTSMNTFSKTSELCSENYYGFTTPVASYCIPAAQQTLGTGSEGKESACQCRRPGFDLCFGKILWRGEWQPFQCSCLENSMDRGACCVRQSQTQLSDLGPNKISEAYPVQQPSNDYCSGSNAVCMVGRSFSASPIGWLSKWFV